ncbi:MAG: N-acetylmuramoyl-L-alanine amidase [Thermomicrobium sp.]|nr:N-acetylmuramoyl-L-alanine amidase [Thermomicrobium sp.]
MDEEQALRYVNDLPFIRARWIYGRRDQTNWIVLHSIEAPERLDTAEACARYFQTTDRQASTQFVCDADSTIRCADIFDVVAGAKGANRTGVHIEQAGFAAQSESEWNDAYSLRMVDEQVAPLVAALCVICDVPVVFCTDDDIRAGRRGITTHHEIWKVFGGDVRTDPGPHYPIHRLLQQVETILGQEDDMTPQDRAWLEQKFAEVQHGIATSRDAIAWGVVAACASVVKQLSGGRVDVDRQALAKEVADELARRLDN